MYSRFLALTLVLVTGFSSAATIITPAKGVHILAVNGVLTDDKRSSAEAPNGTMQVVARYNEKLGSGSSARVYDSQPFIFLFDAVDTEVKITAPKVYSYDQAVRVFKKNPEWTVTSERSSIEFTQDEFNSEGKLLPFVNIENAIQEHNKNKGIYFDNGKLIDKPVEAQVIAAATTTAAVTSTSSKVEKTATAKPVASSNVDQLKAWYLKSSKEERKAFRRWMIDQE